MTTALDLIQSAGEELGIFDPGEKLTNADAQRGLTCLNRMFDSWSNENLMCYALTEQSIVLVNGQQQYTIGPGGAINGTRPLKILDAFLLDYEQNRYPVNIIERDAWNNIGLNTVNSQLPDTIWYDPQFPLGVINVYPIPTIPYTLYVDSMLDLPDMPELNTVLALPPGYEEAIQHNLALRLAPFYGVMPPQIIVALAAETKGIIKRQNLRENIAGFDSEIVSKANSTYNIYRDSPR